ncbi:MAG: Protein-glutamate methylesterase/protein-glutamine glutaminase [Chlamydiales bacterium]|nr:Protein-glutamate methylesterase/protein-glutamine glutaminase [Chlamydiales bacterium]MCH9619305.1 Protein-glutamate methylesterase/protein-glutamine glutaminase [Chlamydiales bacterium]MCH9622567.1 Protein-glutamate methylesterase/protein-glutamine glutaminase [Chlamydiales bacterium]
MSSFLCFDPSETLDPIFAEYGALFGFTHENVKTEEELVENYTKESYAGCFIVETEQEKDLFSLLQKLISIKRLPIVVFVDQSRSSKSFQKLKIDLKVDFVLETPIDKNEVSSVLRKFSAQEKDKNEGDSDLLPPELVEKYVATIYDKIESIELAIQRAHEAYGSTEPLVEFRNIVHKIAGSAGAYGFGEAGQLCKAQEIFLYDIYNEPTITLTQKEIDEPNITFLRKVRLAFQGLELKTQPTQPSTKKAPRETSKAPPSSSAAAFMVLITTDLGLVRLFQKVAAQRHVSLDVESDPQHFLEKWNDPDAQPGTIILEEFFPFTSFSGIQLVDKMKSIWPNTPILYGILTQTDDLDKRLEWLTQGIDFVLKKPLTQENIVHLFDQISTKQTFQKIKALVVDDDEDIGSVEVMALEQLGIHTTFLQDETRLIKTLEEVDPDLLILDINLPRYSGKELLQTLRADVRFRNLIIVVATAIMEDKFDQWAYAANCDEIVHKPIDISFFQARISNLLQRHSSIASKARLDPVTGLFPKDYFLAKLSDLFSRSVGMQLGFTMLKLDSFENLSSLLSPLELKGILIQIAELIKSQFYKSSLIGYLDEGNFGVLFSNLLGGEIEFIIKRFYEEVKKRVLITGRENIKISLSGAISLFVAGKIPISTVIEETEKSLKHVREEGPFHLATKRLSEKEAIPEKSRVIMVDDDHDLCEVISYALRNHGFQIDVFNTGEDAIHYFSQLEKLEDNTLVILDRILPDRDGLTLLHLIREKFPGKIKAIFLSSLSTEKDVLAGLKMGALDYVTKPFSVSVLLQKALMLIHQ